MILSFLVREGIDGGWQPTFKIDNQQFALAEKETIEEATWMQAQLLTAFTKLMDSVVTGTIQVITSKQE